MRDRLQKAFAGVHAEAGLKERTIRSIYSNPPAVRPAGRRLRPLAIAAACLVLALGLGGGLFFTPVSSIGIEINPAMRLKINRFDRVIGVEALNRDGEAILKNNDLMFDEYSQAIGDLLSDPRLRAYLDKGRDMEIYVECDDEQRCTRMLEKVEGCVGGEGHVTCHAGSGSQHCHSAGEQGCHKHHRHRGGAE